MNSEHKHIDFELLRAYFNGELSESERQALEERALEDPFLQDAMDGFAENPGALDKFAKKHIKRKSNWRKSTAARTITIITVAIGIYLVSFFFQKEINENENPELADSSITDSIITKEVEVIPVEIDTLEMAEPEEVVSSEKIVEEKKEIQKEVNYDTVSTEERIVIDENVPVEIETELIPEERDLKVKERVPATYLFEMFVVDYRRIKRDKTTVSYTKYELSGTSAEFENEETMQNRELVEHEIDVPYFEYLRTSMEYFRDGYYKRALKRYLTILEQYENDANALFYGGLCYFNMKQYQKSIDLFDRLIAIDLDAFKEEAKWYKVKCLIKLGRKTDAKNLLDEIIIEGGFYMEDAMELRGKI